MVEKPVIYAVEIAGRRFELAAIEGCERLSRASRFNLRFLVPDDDLEPDDILREAAAVLIARDEQVRRIEGIITEAELSLKQDAAPDMALVIEHPLALLMHRKDIRIHRNLTVPQIVSEVCAGLGVKVELRLTGDYEERPFCVQYRESDYDYVNRLLEDEGIFYICANQETIVLGDAVSGYEALPGGAELPFRAASGQDRQEDFIFDLGSHAELTAGEVTLRDWNAEHPSLDMDVRAAISQVAGGAGTQSSGPEWYDYPGEFSVPEQGRRKAQLTAESFACAAAAFVGHSSCGRLVPGATFTLLDAPAGAPDGELLVVQVEHSWDRIAEGFTNTFEALRAEDVYRPPRTTHVPRILNPMTGIVTVPPNDEDDIHCDEYGRIKVHFHWDRLQPYDDTCSHWIPVLQDNTGESSAIPRNEWEMMVHFMEGDPDRPVVLGRVYNAADPHSQQPVPEYKSRSLLRSMSTPKRSLLANEIQFEDSAGGEFIRVHAGKDQNVRIANNKTEQVATVHGSRVERDERLSVGSNSEWVIGNDAHAAVENAQTWSVGGTRNKNIGRSDGSVVEQSHLMVIGGDHERVAGTQAAMNARTLDETVGGALIEQFSGGQTFEAVRTLDVTVGGSVIETCEGERSDNTMTDRSESIAGVAFMKATGSYNLRAGQTRTTDIAGSLSASSNEEMTFIGREQAAYQAGSVSLSGAESVLLIVGESHVQLEAGLVSFVTPGKVSLVASGANEQAAGQSFKN